MFLTDAEERTPGLEVSECDKELAAWAEGELGVAAPFLNNEIGASFPEVIEGGEPEGRGTGHGRRLRASRPPGIPRRRPPSLRLSGGRPGRSLWRGKPIQDARPDRHADRPSGR